LLGIYSFKYIHVVTGRKTWLITSGLL